MAQQALDRLDRLMVACFPDIGHVKEGSALAADVDERRLHPGQHARDFADVDVPHQTQRGRALGVQFLHHGLLHDGHARLLGSDVHQDVFAHKPIPNDSSSSTVSYSGKPMTPV